MTRERIKRWLLYFICYEITVNVLAVWMWGWLIPHMFEKVS
jgi:hypothetical protein